MRQRPQPILLVEPNPEDVILTIRALDGEDIGGLAVPGRIHADERTHRLPVIMLSTSCDEREVAFSAYWFEPDDARPTPEGMS